MNYLDPSTLLGYIIDKDMLNNLQRTSIDNSIARIGQKQHFILIQTEQMKNSLVRVQPNLSKLVLRDQIYRVLFVLQQDILVFTTV
jgi:hypothetical protein